MVIDAGPEGAPAAENVLNVRITHLPETAAALAAPLVLQPAAIILATREGLEPGQALHATKVTRQQ